MVNRISEARLSTVMSGTSLAAASASIPLRITEFLYSKKLKNTTFRKLDLFPSSGEEVYTLLGSLERAILDHCATHVRFKVMLRLTASRSVRLRMKHPCGT
jgi:hypothetical protein